MRWDLGVCEPRSSTPSASSLCAHRLRPATVDARSLPSMGSLLANSCPFSSSNIVRSFCTEVFDEYERKSRGNAAVIDNWRESPRW